MYDDGWADLNTRLRALVGAGARHGAAGSNEAPELAFEPSA